MREPRGVMRGALVVWGSASLERDGVAVIFRVFGSRGSGVSRRTFLGSGGGCSDAAGVFRLPVAGVLVGFGFAWVAGLGALTEDLDMEVGVVFVLPLRSARVVAITYGGLRRRWTASMKHHLLITTYESILQ